MRRTYWMSVEQLCTIIAALMLASCVRVQAQFGVEQPIFSVSPSSSSDYPAQEKLVLLNVSDYGVSNNILGTSLTNGAKADWWYFKTVLSGAGNEIRLQGREYHSSPLTPLWYSNVVNGYPAIRTSSSDGTFFTTATTTSSNYYYPTIFMVMRHLNYSSAAVNYGNLVYINSTVPIDWNFKGTPTNSCISSAVVSSEVTATNAMATNVWRVITVGLRTNNTFMRVNGTYVLDKAISTTNRNRFESAALCYGAIGNDYTVTADWAEMRIYDLGLSTNDMVTIEGLLQTKYGITP